MDHLTPTHVIAHACTAIAVVILGVFLVRRPLVDFRTKLWLLLGLGVFPTLAAASSSVAGMQATTERRFCGSCHVMTAHYGDAGDPSSQSLAARHSRNPFFGGRSCYVCHADYGMYGHALTKLGGLRHVYEYYLHGYKDMPLEQFKREIKLRKPYDNTNCRQCHTTSLHDWRRVADHVSLTVEVESNRVSCASAGCHGYAHPFTKPPPGVPAGAGR